MKVNDTVDVASTLVDLEVDHAFSVRVRDAADDRIGVQFAVRAAHRHTTVRDVHHKSGAGLREEARPL